MKVTCRFGRAVATYESGDGWQDGPLYPQLQAETDYFLTRPSLGYDPNPVLTLCQWVTEALAGSIVSITGQDAADPDVIY